MNGSLGFSPRLDYVKFIVSMDYDLAQQVFRTLNGAISQPDCHLQERDNYKVTVLGADPGNGAKRRYVVEAWGLYSVELAALVPTDWFEHLARVDWRAPLLKSNHEGIKSYIQQRVLSRNGKRNVTAFDTKNRQKTNTRDVGGVGLILGSRKSEAHTSIYFRADEQGAVETRHQGRAAERIGLYVCQSIDQGGALNWYEALHKAVEQASKSELYKACGVTEVCQLENLINDAERKGRIMQQAMEWAEHTEERDYWSSLTPEQQEIEQGLANVPTEMFKTRQRGTTPEAPKVPGIMSPQEWADDTDRGLLGKHSSYDEYYQAFYNR